MPDPPRDKEEYAIRFGCSLLIAFPAAALLLIRILRHTDFPILVLLVIAALASLLISHLMARKGDNAWENLLSFFRNW